MKITIVNSFDINKTYVIKDSTPEFNLPRIDQKYKLMLSASYSNNFFEMTTDNIQKLFHYNSEKFFFFIFDEELENFIKDSKTLIRNNISLSIFSNFKLFQLSNYSNNVPNAIKVTSQNYKTDNEEYVSLTTSLTNQKLMFNFRFLNYKKNDVDEKISEHNDKFDNAKNYIVNTYKINKKPFESAPSLHEIYRLKEELFKPCKLSFSCYNAIDASQLQINNVFYDDIKQTNMEMNYINGKYVYSFYIPTYKFLKIEHKIKIQKVDFFDFKKTYKAYTYSEVKNLNHEIDLGVLPLVNVRKANAFAFTWGEEPWDLDLHLFEFNENLECVGHCYFSNRYLGDSGVMLDVDDTSSFGPETITIETPNPNYYYLYSIHNYSQQGYQGYFNYDLATKFNFILSGNVFTITPNCGSELVDSTWLDVAIRHDNKIYILNKLIPQDERNSSCEINLTSDVLNDVLENNIPSSNIIDLNDYNLE